MRSQHGQAMVEFLLTIPFIFVLFLGMIEIIFLMYSYNTLADAAKEGVRYAIVHGTGKSTGTGMDGCSGPGLPSASPPVVCSASPYSNVQNVVISGNAPYTPPAGFLSLQGLSAGDVTVDYNPNSANGTACNTPGCLVRVTVRKTYRPFFGLGWPRVTLNASADGRIMY